jgi:hypothetical protein
MNKLKTWKGNYWRKGKYHRRIMVQDLESGRIINVVDT